MGPLHFEPALRISRYTHLYHMAFLDQFVVCDQPANLTNISCVISIIRSVYDLFVWVIELTELLNSGYRYNAYFAFYCRASVVIQLVSRATRA